MASTDKQSLAFIGIGTMGYGMALNLRRKLPPSTTLLLCEINTTRRDHFVEQCENEGLGKLEVIQSPREIGGREDVGVVVTMLPKAQHVEGVFLGEDGLLAGGQGRDRFFIECSSINTEASTKLAEKVISNGDAFIDAPVSGGPAGADAGTLTFMVGGPEDLFKRSLAVLELMGKRDAIFHCGGPGAGLATKQLNNYLGYVGYLGLCEVMSTGLKYGLDPKTLSDVINKSSGMNWNSLHHNPVKGVMEGASSNSDFKPGFTVELAAGVIEDATDLMEMVGAQTLLAGRVRAMFERAVRSERTKGLEARSVWRLFVEDGGREVEEVVEEAKR
jgi:3-hydroxyisobutyrate/3-hydroxypropionate dehydrogenase